MQFLSKDIGNLVLKELSQAVEAQIAVAFFNPRQEMQEALAKIEQLELIVSEEFTINNPYKLEELTNATLRSIPTDAENGKLHAKVIIIKRQDGSHIVILGSANLTNRGMFSNQEACTVIESSDSIDQMSISEIKTWFAKLYKDSSPLDITKAKSIYKTRSQYRLEPRPKQKENIRYWALKTTSGAQGDSHWPMFLQENVVAIGWENIPIDPSKVSDEELYDAIKATPQYQEYTNKEIDSAVRNIRKFVNLKIGDIILICRGYSGNQKTAVFIHGLARINSSFRAEPKNNDNWRFKFDAVIQKIDGYFPKESVAGALGKESLRQTIHELKQTDIEQLAEKLDIQIEV